ncbi:hypothetical protein, partial [Enterobacter intestinihominis]
MLSLSEELRRFSYGCSACWDAGSRCGRRTTRNRWSWSDRSDSGRTTDRRCNKPDKTGLSAVICA